MPPSWNPFAFSRFALPRSRSAGLLAIALAACGGGGSSAPAPEPVLPDTAFTLQVLHVADMDSGGDLVNNANGISALIQAFRAEQRDRTVFLSSGDNYIPGPFFFAADDAVLNPELGASGAGRGDIEILNLLGLQASAVGNHDLDLGTNFFGGLLRASGAWRGTQFPYLSANLDFSADANLASLALPANAGAEAATLSGLLAPSTVITVDGERIGIVGASTPTLPSITSVGDIRVLPGGEGVGDIDKLATRIQLAVDTLTDQGIDKVILLAHMQQLEIERMLATRLRGVDLIIAGGSNTGLYDADDRIRPGDTDGGVYPLPFTSASGDPVLVVNVDADYKYLGRIVLPFDADGRVIVGRLDTAVNGAWATDAEGLARAGLTVAADALPGVVAITDKTATIIEQKDGNVFGATSVYLEGDRVLVRNRETNLGNLSADANLAYARSIDPSATVSIKNGGGIRSSIGLLDIAPGATTGAKGPTRANEPVGKLAGDVSQLDIEFALRFNNGLSLLTLTAAELKAVIEHGVSNWTPTSTQGRFPQVGGIRFSFDPSLAPGARVRTLVVDDPDGSGPIAGPQVVYSSGVLRVPDATTYRIVTLDFLSGGGDAYPFTALAAPNRVDLVTDTTKTFTTLGGEQRALADHLSATYPRATPFAAADPLAAVDQGRIQNLSQRTDSLPQN